MNSGTRRFIGTVNFSERWTDLPLSSCKRIVDGVVASPFTAELLAFEMAANAFRFAPRRQLLHELQGIPAPGPDTPCRLHPLARLVRFRHDPAALLDAAERRVIASAKIPPRETLIALSMVNGDVGVIQLPDDIRDLLANDGQLLKPLTVTRTRVGRRGTARAVHSFSLRPRTRHATLTATGSIVLQSPDVELWVQRFLPRTWNVGSGASPARRVRPARCIIGCPPLFQHQQTGL